MRAGLALGSNIGDRLQNLRTARRALASLKQVSPPVLASPIYETEAVDCESGADKFWNAAIELGFEGEPAQLLAQTQEIEVALGRPLSHPRNVSRPLDIDLLYFGDTIIEEDGLQVPHPRMFTRNFVLEPLSRIRPDLVLPTQSKSVRELLGAGTGSAKLVALPEQWA
jgi:2-amino-4-hydroxy-6-hydroxymethyldihydropteridine diphosphokinase